MADLFDRLRDGAAAEWSAYVDHPFVEGLADGTLAPEAYRHYLIQDYLFLIQFARAYALGVYKSDSLAEMRAFSAGVASILSEMSLHVRVCAGWGLAPDDLEAAAEARATIAYTRFVLDSGLRGDLLDLQVALVPCIVGYAEIATALAARPGALDAANPYRDWIAEYAGTGYQEVAAKARALLDASAERRLSEARMPQLVALFGKACRLEADFWQMGLDRAD